jgi:hypothetical protein
MPDVDTLIPLTEQSLTELEAANGVCCSDLLPRRTSGP